MARELSRLVDLHQNASSYASHAKTKTRTLSNKPEASRTKKRVTEQVEVLERKEKEYAHVEAILNEQKRL